MALFRKALQFQPGNTDAHTGLGIALFQVGQIPEAIAHLEQALRLRFEDADAHYNLGVVLFRSGSVPEAVAHLEHAFRLKPEDAVARNDLSVALVQLGKALEDRGRWKESLRQYRKALDTTPSSVSALRHLAWVLATCREASVRDGPRAVELAEQANQLTAGKDPEILDTLAAAYAEAGKLNDAVQTAQAALELAMQAGPAELTRRIQERLAWYRTGRSSRELPTVPP